MPGLSLYTPSAAIARQCKQSLIKSCVIITGITPEICCLRFRFASLRQGMGMLRILRQRFEVTCLRGVVLT